MRDDPTPSALPGLLSQLVVGALSRSSAISGRRRSGLVVFGLTLTLAVGSQSLAGAGHRAPEIVGDHPGRARLSVALRYQRMELPDE